MKTIKNLLNCNLVTISPQASLEKAAKSMCDNDCGMLLVQDKKNLQGVITDRDIIVRAISKGKDANEEIVKDHMSKKVYYCKDSDSALEVVNQMQKHNVGRLVVKNADDEPYGIISFGDIVRGYAKLPNILQKIEEEASSFDGRGAA